MFTWLANAQDYYSDRQLKPDAGLAAVSVGQYKAKAEWWRGWLDHEPGSGQVNSFIVIAGESGIGHNTSELSSGEIQSEKTLGREYSYLVKAVCCLARAGSNEVFTICPTPTVSDQFILVAEGISGAAVKSEAMPVAELAVLAAGRKNVFARRLESASESDQIWRYTHTDPMGKARSWLVYYPRQVADNPEDTTSTSSCSSSAVQTTSTTTAVKPSPLAKPEKKRVAAGDGDDPERKRSQQQLESSHKRQGELTLERRRFYDDDIEKRIDHFQEVDNKGTVEELVEIYFPCCNLL